MYKANINKKNTSIYIFIPKKLYKKYKTENKCTNLWWRSIPAEVVLG